MKRQQRKVTRGAVRARKWVAEREGRSIGSLASASGIDRVRLSRILSGQIVRVSAHDAFAIQRATGGEVSADLFVFDEPREIAKAG